MNIDSNRHRLHLKDLKRLGILAIYYLALLLISFSAALICFQWEVDPGRMTRAMVVHDFRYALVGVPIFIVVRSFTKIND